MVEGGQWTWGDAEQFGRVLVALRTSRNLSQRALAASSGVSTTTVSTLESGRKPGRSEPIRPTAQTIAKLADGVARDYADRDVIHPDIRRDAFDRLMAAAKYSAEVIAPEPTAQQRPNRQRGGRTEYLAPIPGHRMSRAQREALQERLRRAVAEVEAIFDELSREDDLDDASR